MCMLTIDRSGSTSSLILRLLLAKEQPLVSSSLVSRTLTLYIVSRALILNSVWQVLLPQLRRSSPRRHKLSKALITDISGCRSFASRWLVSWSIGGARLNRCSLHHLDDAVTSNLTILKIFIMSIDAFLSRL